LSERLVTELTAHRTLALRDALANDPGVAFTAVLHALCLGAFYRMSSGTCLEISANSATFSTQAPGLGVRLTRLSKVLQSGADDPKREGQQMHERNEFIWQTGVEEIHIDRGNSATRFKKPLRDNSRSRQ
jgi:hypothetical protein